MKRRFKNLMNRKNNKFFSQNHDPSGSYTGNYVNDFEMTPEQDADDL